MKKLIGFLLFLAAVAASAQVVPSAYVPLGGCAFYDSGTPLIANSVVFLKARGSCNVPATANAVAVTIAATAPNRGCARLGESSLPIATTQPVLAWKGGAGSASGNPIVRLCYPAEECGGEDLALSPSVDTRIKITILGYFEPLP